MRQLQIADCEKSALKAEREGLRCDPIEAQSFTDTDPHRDTVFLYPFSLRICRASLGVATSRSMWLAISTTFLTISAFVVASTFFLIYRLSSNPTRAWPPLIMEVAAMEKCCAPMPKAYHRAPGGRLLRM